MTQPALPGYWAEKKRETRTISAFIDALKKDDRQQLCEALEQIDENVASGWRRTFLRIARLDSIDQGLRLAFLQIWLESGDHLRQEVGDDLLLVRGLRVLLPPYDGPAVTLYRGETAGNRRDRTYGLSWSSDRNVAEAYATTGLCRTCEFGSVLLQALSPPEAIICAPAAHDDRFAEAEYLVDRRRLRDVTVLQRHCRLVGETAFARKPQSTRSKS